MNLFFGEECRQCEQEDINDDDLIGYRLNLRNKMWWILSSEGHVFLGKKYLKPMIRIKKKLFCG